MFGFNQKWNRRRLAQNINLNGGEGGKQHGKEECVNLNGDTK